MKFWIKLGSVLGLISICFGAFAESPTLTMGVFSWEPYVSTNPEHYGVISEIAITALERTGYKIEVHDYPFSRVMKNLEFGIIDIAPAISPNTERAKTVDFSSPIYNVEMGFTFKKGRIHYQTISDLKAYTAGVMLGTFWINELTSAGILYEGAAEQEQNIRKLILDRVDFVCMPKGVAWHLLTQMGEDPNNYEFGLFKHEGQPLGISKRTPFKTLREDFERGLASIKRDGTYDKIVAKYK
ncbi:substrate-binding periplasmic protein [Uliginosibacterium gangwonense]|uniref:substrate-binding periplasmic protein n=1 Tax=Uliginosibacterium gangwonense TaxID=392736 RepID=UPI0003743FCD|nr:transporter substrate-binding domain-containing protein [Uliginosibacterium gangwonense]